jgi:hypothetical protein
MENDVRAVRIIRRVGDSGNLQLEDLQFPPGQTVEVTVLPFDDESGDLMKLAESGLTFWDNPIDDEVWNDALPPA